MKQFKTYCPILLLLLLRFQVHGQLVADFNANLTQGCAPLLVQFTNTSTGSPTSVLWNFGNGNTSTLSNPGASYILSGVYTVTLTVRNGSNNNVKTRTNYITVFPKPTADFTSTPNNGCAPLAVTFTDISTVANSTITNWSWDFGNGGYSTSKNPVNNYLTPGSYKVSLVVTDAHGCTDNISKNGLINVVAKPVVDFSSDITFGCDPPLITHFTSTVTPSGSYSFLWDFGNSTTSALANPTATYSVASNATVKLQIWNSAQCTVTVIKPNYIQFGNIIPDFTLGANSNLCMPGKVFLYNTTSPNVAGLTYEWYVNNVASGTSKDLLLNNLSQGAYTIKLKITVGGCIRIIEKVNFFTIKPKPAAYFTTNKTQFCKTPASVSFTDSSFSGASWYWTFGNGSVSTQRNPTLIYNQFGSFDVTLITTAANGCKDTITKSAYVNVIPPNVKLLINPKDGCNPLLVDFGMSDSTLPSMNSFIWTFGDGAGSGATTKVAHHTYNNVGSYVVTMNAMNSEGCSVSLYDTVKVGQLIVPDFNALKRVYCYSEQPVIIQNLTTNVPPGTAWIWHYGDGSTSSAFNALHIYKDTGYFIVTLDAVHNGCISSVTKNAYIRILAPIASFSISKLPCIKTPVTFTNTSKGGTTFSWDFGDGTTYAGRFTTHTYQNPGKYIISLSVYDSSSGCTSVANDSIILNASIDPTFIQNLTIGCAPFTLILTNTSTPLNNVSNCMFTVNGATYSGNTVNVPISNQGLYDITMNVTDINGCVIPLVKSQAVKASNADIKMFVSPFIGCAPLWVQAVDSSKADLKIIRRVWSWGNGDSTVVTNNDSIVANYRYLQGPAFQIDGYFVRLRLIDSMGCVYNTQRKIFIFKPTPDFVITTVKKCDSDSLIFYPVKDSLIGFAPFTFTWKVGSQFFPGKLLTKKFTGDTTLPVTLKVTDNNGCSNSIVKDARILTGLPVPDFYGVPVSINCPGPPVHFYDRSTAKNSPLVSWSWEFGDGGKSTLKNPSRIYLQPGSYSVFLTIKDSLGCIATKTAPDFVVISGPKGNFSFTPNSGCTPLSVKFFSIGTDVAKFEWDLGDGYIDTNQNLVHTYIRPGIFIPNLTITDSTGCKIGLQPIDSIVVHPNPQPDFTLSKYSACLNSDVIFTGNIIHSLPITKWDWLIDQTSYSGMGPVTYTANSIGSINVILTVTDEAGCIGVKNKPAILNVFQDSVNDARPLIYRATVENDEQVKIEFRYDTIADFDHYILYSNYINGVWAQRQNIVDVKDTVQLFKQLNTLQNTYSYALQSVDVCKNYSVISRRHTTIELKASGAMNAVALKWDYYQGWDSVKSYAIYRYDDGKARYDSIASVVGSVNAYIDSVTYCHKVLFYKIKAIDYQIKPLISWSDTAAAIPIFVSTVPGTHALRATVLDNKQVLVQWHRRTLPVAFSYEIHRSSADPDQPEMIFGLTSRDTFLIDTKVDVQRFSYRYLIFLKDACGGLSIASNSAKTILLNAEIVTDKVTADPVLTWNAYEEWNTGIKNYSVLFKYDSLSYFSPFASRTPKEILSVTHEYINYNQDDYCYQVVAYQQDSEWVESWSNIACVSTSPRLFAPDAITINGDQLNDGFRLKGVFIKSFQLRIWNRWGLLLFETTDINEAWDGTFHGQQMPSDVYVFEAWGFGKQGKFKTLKGNVTILR